MFEHFFDRIVILLASVFVSESARQLAKKTTKSFNKEEQDALVNDGEIFDPVAEKNLGRPSDYGSLPNNPTIANERTFLCSCKLSFVISFSFTAAIIPASIIMIAVLYVDVNTANICFQSMMDNRSLPSGIMKYVIIGHDIEGMVLNFWFQLTLVLLFSWKEFRLYFSSTLVLGFVLGFVVVVYKTTLFMLNIDFTQTIYRYPGNAVFTFGVLCSSYIVAKRVSNNISLNQTQNQRLKKRHIFVILSTQYFLGACIAFAYRYKFVPWYRSTESDIGKATIALITPTLIIIPMVIAENLALKSSSFTDYDRIFVLVYFINGVSVMLYRIMQAAVKDTNIFILLSLIRGAAQIFQTATVKLRQKIARGIWQCFERKCISRPRLREMEETEYHRRLKVAKEIQIMLYQSITVILSEAYLVLYLTSNYHVQTIDVLSEFIFKRLAIGVGINFIANYFSILIHIHWHKTKLPEVWRSQWKLHWTAVIMVGVMSVCYFTTVLLSVFKTLAKYKQYHAKECKPPFQ